MVYVSALGYAFVGCNRVQTDISKSLNTDFKATVRWISSRVSGGEIKNSDSHLRPPTIDAACTAYI